MPNKLKVLDQIFSSQKDAEAFFYQIRDNNFGAATDIAASKDFDLLRELYVKYCECTGWPMSEDPVAFCVRNIGRGSGASGGTTQGFVVKFSNGTEQEFSARKAIRAIANS
jgi:hypothetical protein